MPCHESLQEILTKVQEIAQAGHAKYTVQVVRNLSPAWSGYPTRRTRAFLIGWRADIGGARVGEPLQSLMNAPMMVEQTFLRFLGLQRQIDWSRMGECPTPEELSYVSTSSCKCGLDPMVRCPAHPCKCGKCGALDPVSWHLNVALDPVSWRLTLHRASWHLNVALDHLSWHLCHAAWHLTLYSGT